MLRGTARRLAGRRVLPTSLRAVLGYYAATGTVDVGSLGLKGTVDDVTDEMLADAFGAVEAAIAEEFDRDSVEFSYDTKLILPAKLTLGYLYRQIESGDRRERAEDLTRLAVEALLDGDMRDAINDDEYEDFEVSIAVDGEDRERLARIAQETLEERVADAFEAYPTAVREAYDWAVEISEGHQIDDGRFRELFAAAEAGEAEALAAIEAEYRDLDFEERPATLDPGDATLPYARTQYERVGVIYDGMLRMFESEDFDIEPAFARSIVLAIVGAQIWLDDVDDYRADRREDQLTPVTAEYLLADDQAAAREQVVAVAETYLDRATAAAADADSPLTGIATEYIYRSGDPSVLPDGSG